MKTANDKIRPIIKDTIILTMNNKLESTLKQKMNNKQCSKQFLFLHGHLMHFKRKSSIIKVKFMVAMEKPTFDLKKKTKRLTENLKYVVLFKNCGEKL